MVGELHGEQQCAPLFFLHIPRKNSEIQRDFLRKLEEISGVFPLFCL